MLMSKSITRISPVLILILNLVVFNSYMPVSNGLPFIMSCSSNPNPNPKPKLALPKALDSQIPGTWSYDTMTRRIDSEILQRTYDENEIEFKSPKFASALVKFNALRLELRNAGDTKLRHLHPIPITSGTTGTTDSNTHDRDREMDEWRNILTPFVDDRNDTWLSCPWMVAEFYVYRRLLEALGYFDPSVDTVGYDPFDKQKRMGLIQSISLASPILAQMEPFLNIDINTHDHQHQHQHKHNDITLSEQGMGLAIAFALWGNKMDLSLWPADSTQNTNMPDMFDAILRSADDNLLHDDTHTLIAYTNTLRDATSQRCRILNKANKHNNTNEPRPIRVDIIVDNAGFELIMDLVLADYLIASGIADTVRFQLKAHPTFVSDAMEKDLVNHISHYADSHGDGHTPTTRCAGQRWRDHLLTGRWQCHEDNFWVQPPPMWEMPPPLRQNLAEGCDLAFVKGDANYRRLLGDLAWDPSEDGFEDVVGAYFPCPVCALRTLKAEVGCGMEKELVERARGLDENWSVNGRFGVVQFSMGAGADTSGGTD